MLHVFLALCACSGLVSLVNQGGSYFLHGEPWRHGTDELSVSALCQNKVRIIKLLNVLYNPRGYTMYIGLSVSPQNVNECGENACV